MLNLYSFFINLSKETIVIIMLIALFITAIFTTITVWGYSNDLNESIRRYFDIIDKSLFDDKKK